MLEASVALYCVAYYSDLMQCSGMNVGASGMNVGGHCIALYCIVDCSDLMQCNGMNVGGQHCIVL